MTKVKFDPTRYADGLAAIEPNAIGNDWFCVGWRDEEQIWTFRVTKIGLRRIRQMLKDGELIQRPHRRDPLSGAMMMDVARHPFWTPSQRKTRAAVVILKCDKCGASFDRKAHDVKRNQRRGTVGVYCSRLCQQKGAQRYHKGAMEADFYEMRSVEDATSTPEDQEG